MNSKSIYVLALFIAVLYIDALRLQYVQCINNGDTAVLHQATDI